MSDESLPEFLRSVALWHTDLADNDRLRLRLAADRLDALQRRVKELEALIGQAHCGLCSYVYTQDNPAGVYRIAASFVEAMKADLRAALSCTPQ